MSYFENVGKCSNCFERSTVPQHVSYRHIWPYEVIVEIMHDVTAKQESFVATPTISFLV